MTNDAFKDIEKLETDLWEAADNLHANSKLTSSDYFMPVLGVIFLRHAANRFDAAHRQIEADRASGKMPRRKVLPADYIARRSLYLPKKARYDWIMEKAALSGGELPELVTAASLDAEQRRAAEEGPTDDELALFELLFKDSMSKKDRERLKQASRGLLSSLRDLLARAGCRMPRLRPRSRSSSSIGSGAHCLVHHSPTLTPRTSRRGSMTMSCKEVPAGKD